MTVELPFENVFQISCVCECVHEREREREGEGGKKRACTKYIGVVRVLKNVYKIYCVCSCVCVCVREREKSMLVCVSECV